MNKIVISLIMFILIAKVHGFEYLEKPPTHWKSQYVLVDGVRLHYWRTGVEKPVILMAHGSSDYGLCWTNIAKELESEYDIIMVDARGHGFSDPYTKDTPEDVQAEDIARFIKALKLNKPIVMGHSMGSSAAAWFAAKHSDLAKAIVLEDPRLIPREVKQKNKKSEAQYILNRQKGIIGRNNMSAKDLAEQCLERSPQWGKSECDIWASSKLLHHPSTAFRKRGAMPAMNVLFESIQIPTLILKADDSKENQTKNHDVVRILKQGKLVHIEGAGHNVRRDQKKAFLRELKDFLKHL